MGRQKLYLDFVIVYRCNIRNHFVPLAVRDWVKITTLFPCSQNRFCEGKSNQCNEHQYRKDAAEARPFLLYD